MGTAPILAHNFTRVHRNQWGSVKSTKDLIGWYSLLNDHGELYMIRRNPILCPIKRTWNATFNNFSKEALQNSKTIIMFH